jgi:hypothetical protein
MINHGRFWFVGAIFIISCFTYILAIYIGNVLAFLKIPAREKSHKKGNKEKTGPHEPPNLWRGLSFVLKWMKRNGPEGSFRGNDKEWEARNEKKALDTEPESTDSAVEVEQDGSEFKLNLVKWIKEHWLKGDFRETEVEKETRLERETRELKSKPNNELKAAEQGESSGLDG